MKYFRLHFFVHYVSGDNGGCLYNMQTRKMIYITKENNEILRRAENNQEIEEMDSFLRELYDANMGSFYERPVYIEKTRLGVSKEYDEVAAPKSVVKHAFIQVTNDCKADCIFCDASERVYTKTRCKKWSNVDKGFEEDTWKVILGDLYNLQCETISFIGGDPLLAFDRIQKCVLVAEGQGIRKFEVYTNLSGLTEQQAEFFRGHQVTVNVQIAEWKDNSVNTRIKRSDVIRNITHLLANGVRVCASVLLTRYNESEWQAIVAELQGLGAISVKLDFFYENEDNNHFSEKLKNEMYKKQFLEVNPSNFAFFERYNNCLYGKVSINLFGDVTPCPMMNNFVIGNVFEESLHGILSRTEYQDVVRVTREKVEHCGNCAFRMNCVDCRALEYHATGKINGVRYCENLSQLRAYK